MTNGAYRSNVAYLWPRTLRVPKRPPKLVYLDLNHWISLAKATLGHEAGAQYEGVLRACSRSVETGNAIFPVSSTTFIEISKNDRHKQRRALRNVIEKLSRFSVVANRQDIMIHECEALLDSLAGPNPMPVPTTDYVDWGVARAFGLVGGLRAYSKDGRDVTAEVRSKYKDGPDAFDAVLLEEEVQLVRQVLEGPSPEDEAKMRDSGWDPKAAYQVAQRRARQEQEFARELDAAPRWRRGRIRDAVSAHELLVEVNRTLATGLMQRGAALSELLASTENAREAFDSMPSFDVAVSLKTVLHRNPAHQWTPNDVKDIDALAAALPFCDIVVTDRAMCSHCINAGLAERLNTVVLSHLDQLEEHL